MGDNSDSVDLDGNTLQSQRHNCMFNNANSTDNLDPCGSVIKNHVSRNSNGIYRHEVDTKITPSQRQMCYSTSWLIRWAIAGLSIIIISLVSIPLITLFINFEIKKKVVLAQDSTSPFYPEWKKPSIPIYLQLYMFNVTNPKEIMKGDKPKLTQHGPYTYLEKREKFNITFNSNGTVTYKQLKIYTFLPEMSIGNDTDSYMTLNFPMVIILQLLDDVPHILRLPISLMLRGISLFREYRVKDIVWGYRDPLLVIAKKLYPKQFYTDVAGIMIDKNNTDDGTYTVFTGADDLSKIGIIDKYNGSRSLDFWTSPQANMVNGSDGTVIPPFVSKDTELYVFSSEVCRSLSGVYNSEMTNNKGIHVYKFIGSETCLANATDYPPNAGFCTPAGNCMDTGVLNVSTCLVLDGLHLPVIVSFPHFHMAADKYKSAIIGLDNDTSQYETLFYLEPQTGILLEAYKRMQMNLHLKPAADIKQTKHITHDIVFPILWGNESVIITDHYQDMLYSQLVLPQAIIHIVQMTLIGVGGLMFAVSSASLGYIRCRRKLLEASLGTERQPILINASGSSNHST